MPILDIDKRNLILLQMYLRTKYACSNIFTKICKLSRFGWGGGGGGGGEAPPSKNSVGMIAPIAPVPPPLNLVLFQALSIIMTRAALLYPRARHAHGETCRPGVFTNAYPSMHTCLHTCVTPSERWQLHVDLYKRGIPQLHSLVTMPIVEAKIVTVGAQGLLHSAGIRNVFRTPVIECKSFVYVFPFRRGENFPHHAPSWKRVSTER